MQISIKDLSFAYEGKQIFSRFNLDVCRGRRLWLSAPSGFGKTTLLRLICGLEKPQSGEIRIEQGAKIAAVFQEDRLLPWLNVSDNIQLVLGGFPQKARRELADWMLAAVGLEGEERSFPAELSGGMARRVAIARALAADWDILLLDEPFTGIDQAAKEQIARLINSEAADKTVIIITHDPTEAALLEAERLDMGSTGA